MRDAIEWPKIGGMRGEARRVGDVIWDGLVGGGVGVLMVGSALEAGGRRDGWGCGWGCACGCVEQVSEI